MARWPKITFSCKNALISGQVTQKASWKLGPCLGCLSPDSAFWIIVWWAGSECSPWRRWPHQPWAPQEDKAQKTKGPKSMSWPRHDTPGALRNTSCFWRVGNNFSKHWNPLEIWSFPPLVSFLCLFILVGVGDGGGNWTRSCQMSKLLFGETSWLRCLFWTNLSLGP